MGFELQTTFRFAAVDGRVDLRKSEVVAGQRRIATMRYGDAAKIWRVNLGWRKRKNPNERGFLLDIERGYWAANKDLDETDAEDPMSGKIKRVVPYVEDHRNVLTIGFDVQYHLAVMASLQAALKQGIQQLYQLEPNELATDPLPNFDDRRILFFYEAAEGGAGVLRQVAEEPQALADVARAALAICHFEPDSGEDLAAQLDSKIECEAACYDCLLDYGNQPDHKYIDRKLIVEILQDLMKASTQASGGARGRRDHLDELCRLCDSGLERRWLQQLADANLRLPTHGQHLITACQTRPDFFYHDANTAIFIDGPPHDAPEAQAEDAKITDRLTAAGYLVIRFHHTADWNSIFDQYTDIFGRRTH
jgi:very-short-patch-repair endonuclease